MPENVGLPSYKNSDFENPITISAFSITMAIVLSIIYFVSRVGFNNPVGPIFQALSLAAFLLLSPIGCKLILARLGIAKTETWLLSNSALTVISLLLLVLSGLLRRTLGFNPYPLLGAAGLLLFLMILILFVQTGGRWQNLIFLILGIVAGIFLASHFWSKGYQFPLFEEGVALSTVGHRDTFFHTAISGMLKTYNVSSMGIDGLVPLSYHYGSHWIFAQIAGLLGTSSIQFYQLGYPVIFLPFLLHCFLIAGLELRNYLIKSDLATRPIRQDGWHWLIVLVFLVGIPGVVAPMEISGESYVIGRAWLALTLSLTAYTVRFISHPSQPLKVMDIFLVVFVLPLMVIFSGLLKSPIMFLLILAFLYLFWRYELYRRGLFLLATLSLAVIAFLIYPFSYGTPFSNEGSSVFLENLISRIASFDHFIPFIFSWAYIYLRLRSSGIDTLDDLKVHWQKKDLPDVEIVLIFSIVCTGAELLLTIGGGGAQIYISDVQRWVAFVFLLAIVPAITPTRIIANTTHFPWNIRLGELAIIVVGTFFVCAAAMIMFKEARTAAVLNLQVRRAILGTDASMSALLTKNLQEALDESESYQMIRTLDQLAGLPADQKGKGILFIPRSNLTYWELRGDSRGRNCSTVPLIAPAIANMALLDGVPSTNCQIASPGYQQYYAPYYASEMTHNSLPADPSQAEICHEAGIRGFYEVWIPESDLSTEHLLCEKN